MAKHGNSLFINFSIRFEIVQSSWESPWPGGNRRPVFSWRFIYQSVDAVLKSIIKVWINIGIVNNCQSIASFKYFLYWPPIVSHSSAGFINLVIRYSKFGAVVYITFRNWNLRILMDTLIAIEVVPKNKRNSFFTFSWQKDHDAHLHRVFVIVKAYHDFFGISFTWQCLLICLPNFKIHLVFKVRNLAIYILFKKRQQLRPAYILPVVYITNFFSLLRNHQWRQSVFWNIDFIVIGLPQTQYADKYQRAKNGEGFHSSMG